MWLLTSLSLGLDSLIVSAAVAPLLKSSHVRLLLAVLFGLFDGIGSLIGSEVGWRLSADLSTYAEVGLVLLYAVYVLALAAWGSRNPVSWPVWIMPALLSVDNLFAGRVAGAGGLPVGLVVLYLGLSSCAMSVLGLLLGGLISKARGGIRARELGIGLVIASALLLVF
jgi:putative Mn2+ efflux pump MntP